MKGCSKKLKYLFSVTQDKFIDAVLRNDAEKVTEYIRLVDPEIPSKRYDRGWDIMHMCKLVNTDNALSYCLIHGFYKIVNILIQDKRIDVNSNQGSGHGLLFSALSSTRVDTIKLLLKRDDYKPFKQNIIAIYFIECSTSLKIFELLCKDKRFSLHKVFTKIVTSRLHVPDLIKKLKTLIRCSGYEKVNDDHILDEYKHLCENWRLFLPEWNTDEHQYYPDDFKEKVLVILMSKKIHKDLKLLLIKEMVTEFRKIKN